MKLIGTYRNNLMQFVYRIIMNLKIENSRDLLHYTLRKIWGGSNGAIKLESRMIGVSVLAKGNVVGENHRKDRPRITNIDERLWRWIWSYFCLLSGLLFFNDKQKVQCSTAVDVCSVNCWSIFFLVWKVTKKRARIFNYKGKVEPGKKTYG